MEVLASYAIWAYSWNFAIFVIARIIGGLSKGNVTISTAIIADVTSTKNRGKGMVTKKLSHQKNSIRIYGHTSAFELPHLCFSLYPRA